MTADAGPLHEDSPQGNRVYEADIYHGRSLEHTERVYGKTPALLRESAAAWVIENEPFAFSAVHPRSEFDYREEYGYSDGTRSTGTPGFGGEELAEGWYRFPPGPYSPGPERFETVTDVAKRFAAGSIKPYPGPDYVHVPLVVDDRTRYDLIKQVKRVRETEAVNDLLQRHWMIVAVEYSGGVAKAELVNRTATFVLAHTDPFAE